MAMPPVVKESENLRKYREFPIGRRALSVRVSWRETYAERSVQQNIIDPPIESRLARLDWKREQLNFGRPAGYGD